MEDMIRQRQSTAFGEESSDFGVSSFRVTEEESSAK